MDTPGLASSPCRDGWRRRAVVVFTTGLHPHRHPIAPVIKIRATRKPRIRWRTTWRRRQRHLDVRERPAAASRRSRLLAVCSPDDRVARLVHRNRHPSPQSHTGHFDGDDHLPFSDTTAATGSGRFRWTICALLFFATDQLHDRQVLGSCPDLQDRRMERADYCLIVLRPAALP